MATPEQIAAWQHLTETRTAFDPKDRKTATALHNAALKYASLFPRGQGEQVRGTNGGVKRSGFTSPFGRGKGQPIEELGNSDLDWLTNAVRESVNDPAKDRWRDKNQALLDALEREQATR
jgi:hypothetical protein